jgi:hypothetical protein
MAIYLRSSAKRRFFSFSLFEKSQSLSHHLDLRLIKSRLEEVGDDSLDGCRSRALAQALTCELLKNLSHAPSTPLHRNK